MPLISYTVAAVFFFRNFRWTLPGIHLFVHCATNLQGFVVTKWGLSKIMVPDNALTPRFREPFAPFRTPAESGHEIMIRFSFTYKFINIMVFRPFANLTPPFRGLSPLQQDIHIHICRCHSDTKSLAWVLGQLPNEYGNANLWTQVYCKMNAKMIEG